MKKKLKFLILLMIFFAALNVNAKTISKDGYTYSIEAINVELFDIDANQMITNPSYLPLLITDQNVARAMQLETDRYVINPTITSTTSKDIPTHLIGLNIDQTNLKGAITAFMRQNNIDNDGKTYLVRLKVTYRVTTYPQNHKTLAEHNGMEHQFGNEDIYEILNPSVQNTQVVDVFPLTELPDGVDFSSFSANCQMFFDNNPPAETEWPTRIFTFYNSVSTQTYDSYFDALFASSTYSGTNNDTSDTGVVGGQSNSGANNGSGTTNSGNSGANGNNGSNQNPTTSTGASTDGGDTQIVKVDDTAMSMPIALYIGSTIILLGGALVISKTMQLEDKQD